MRYIVTFIVETTKRPSEAVLERIIEHVLDGAVEGGLPDKYDALNITVKKEDA